MSARRALVTGATGGLGLSLCAMLRDAGYRVRATGRSRTNAARLTTVSDELVHGDLLDMDLRALCTGIDVVFHAAALSSPWGPDRLFHAINVEATQRLLSAARGGGANAFIFVSSPSIYAALHDQVGLTEDSPLPAQALNAYARTKRIAEEVTLAANSSGFSTTAIRPRAIVGTDDKVLLPRIMALASRGWFPALRQGKALIELTDVRDAALALVQADRNIAGAAGKAFNISGGRAMSVADLIGELGDAIGRRIAMRPIPVNLALALGRMTEFTFGLLPGRPEPRLTTYGVATLAYSQTFNLGRARSILNYAPAHDAVATAQAVVKHLSASRS
jgi:nucleoside-diphosphate-sugar epimerase